MIVTREALDDFTFQLGSLGDAAESDMTARLALRLDDLRSEGADSARITEELREAARSMLDENDRTYGASSASLGARTFGETTGERHGEADALDSTALVRKSNAASARYWAGFLDGTDEGFDKFLRGVCAKTRRNVTHMADRAAAGLAVTINGKQKGAGIRFARVPSGAACGFCIMLASRGFVYATRESAGEFTKFHDHCDCRIVAGTKDTQVEGYDPEGMYRRYRMCRDALGTPDDVWRDWDALPDEEKSKYGDAPRIPVFSDPERQRELERFAGKNADTFNDYYTHRIVAEMDTRDREWLYSGKVPEPVVLEGAKPNEEEVRTGNLLSGLGYKVEYRPTRASQGKRTSDIFVVMGDTESKARRVPFEFKEPDGGGNGRWTINHQFADAAGQSNHLVIDITDLESSDLAARWDRDAIEEDARLQVSMPFRVRKGEHKGETWFFEDVTLVSGNDPNYCVKYARRAKK